MNKPDQLKKTTLNLDDKLLQAAKERAEIEGATLSEWLAQAVDLYLTNHWKIDAGIYLVPDSAQKIAEVMWGKTRHKSPAVSKQART